MLKGRLTRRQMRRASNGILKCTQFYHVRSRFADTPQMPEIWNEGSASAGIGNEEKGARQSRLQRGVRLHAFSSCQRPIKYHVSTKIDSDPAQRPASSAQYASPRHLPFISRASEGTLADDIGVGMPHWSLKMPWENIHGLTSPQKTTPGAERVDCRRPMASTARGLLS